MLKPIKNRDRERFITEVAIIKERIINSFNFNRIECDNARDSFWLACLENVMKMMLFVS